MEKRLMGRCGKIGRVRPSIVVRFRKLVSVYKENKDVEGNTAVWRQHIAYKAAVTQIFHAGRERIMAAS
jgi:hypothetical protein